MVAVHHDVRGLDWTRGIVEEGAYVIVQASLVAFQGKDVVLLRHERVWCGGLRKWVAQHGHRSRLWARATVSLRRMVAIEFGTCRSGRIGGAAGSITGGKVKCFELRGGRYAGGNRPPFLNQEAVGCDAKRSVVMETAPAVPLIVPQSEFLLKLLVVALDAPPELGEFDQALEADVLRQRREPVLGGLLLSFRPLDQEPFLWARFAQPVVAMSGSHPHAGKARGEPTGCALAPGDLSPCRLRKSQRQRLDRGRLVSVVQGSRVRPH